MAKIVDYYGDSTIYGTITTDGGVTYQQANPTAVQTFVNSLTTAQTYTANNNGVPGQGTRRLLGLGAEAYYGGVAPLDQLLAASAADICIYNHCLNDADPSQEGNSIDTYKTNLQKIIDLTRYYGKYCIFETPNPAQYFDPSAHVQAMRDVAKANGVPVIDQYAYLQTYLADKGLTVADITGDGEHPTQAIYNLKGTNAATRFKTIMEATIMAHIIEDRVCETTTTTGTGPFILAGAKSAAYRRFNAVCAVGDTAYGVIEAVDADGTPTGDWLTGLFTYSSADTISVTTVYASSDGGAAVNFAAGTKNVYIDLIAYHIKQLASGTAPGTGTPAPNVYPVAIAQNLVSSLLFQDEFDAGALNKNVWNTTVWYEAEPDTVNYAVENSRLKIYPQKNSSGKFFNRTIDTDGKVYFNPGVYIETKAKLPTGYGCWPAIWLLGHETNDRPEIDIMEAYSGGENAGNGGWSDTNNHPLNFAATIHAPAQVQTVGSASLNDVAAFGTYDLSASDHVYGCKWTASTVEFYFDNTLVGTFDISAVTVLNQRLYFLLDLWFGSASGDPNAAGAPTPPTGITNSFEIDYVRIWQLA